MSLETLTIFHVHFLITTKKGTTLFFVHVQGFIIECHHSYKLKEVLGDLSKVFFNFARMQVDMQGYGMIFSTQGIIQK